jgi:hypothetical protein
MTALNNLYKMLRERREQERSFGLSLTKETTRDYFRRSAISTKSLLKYTEMGSQIVGVDFKKIQSIHEREFASLKRFQSVQLKKIKLHVKESALRRQSRVRKLTQLKRDFTGAKGNPTSLICLWTADSINKEGFEVGNCSTSAITTQQAFGKNIFRGTASAGSSYGDQFLYIDFDFVAPDPPRGLLTATGAFIVNGTYSLIASGACFGTNSASAELYSNLRLAQFNSSGVYIDILSPATPSISKSVSGGCSASTDNGPLCDRDEQSITNPTPYPVVAGNPIIASLEFVLQVYAGGDSSATIDLSSLSEFGINAVSIWLVINMY